MSAGNSKLDILDIHHLLACHIDHLKVIQFALLAHDRLRNDGDIDTIRDVLGHSIHDANDIFSKVDELLQ